jgi:hypothetical protein
MLISNKDFFVFFHIFSLYKIYAKPNNIILSLKEEERNLAASGAGRAPSNLRSWVQLPPGPFFSVIELRH